MTLDLEGLERLLGKATPGPWRRGLLTLGSGVTSPKGAICWTAPANGEPVGTEEANGALICALRNAAPELLALARRGQASPASPSADELAALDALEAVIGLLDKAGLLNLSRGVQLGATSWYVKMSDATERARALLARRRAP